MKFYKIKVKQGKKSPDSKDSTPSCPSLIVHRRKSSISKNNIGSSVTPLNSLTKFSLSHRSRDSSGYYSLLKSKSIINNKSSSVIRRSIRRLNIADFSSKPTSDNNKKIQVNQSPKLVKPVNSVPNKLTNTLSSEFWTNMIAKEAVYVRDANYFQRQAHINPQMRSVLLEWMREVIEAYTLENETFYLAVDYLDRYLSVVEDVQIHSFQSLGTTCLFVASKLNEIYPPKADSLANVTDGASSIPEILLHEAHILLKLNWQIQPITVYSWLKLFLQISRSHKNNASKNQVDEYQGPLTRYRYLQSFERSYLSRDFLIHSNENEDLPYLELLNTCIRDVGSLRFPYAVIAASIISIVSNANVLNITGYSSDEISSCKKWLRQFYFSPHVPLKETTIHNVNSNQNGVSRIEKAYSQLNINQNRDKEKENIPPVNC